MMAEQVNDFDWAQSTSSSESKYPWDLWLNGATWILSRGKDYECLDQSIMGQAHRAKLDRNVWVRTANVEPGKVAVQAYTQSTVTALRSNVVAA